MFKKEDSLHNSIYIINMHISTVSSN